jgi:thaumarchaeosortase
MQTILPILKKHMSKLMKLLPLLAFAVPLLWLYFLDPGSFELMWKGRTFELFFLWLILLELILSWENLRESKINRVISARTFAFIATLLLPTIYVIISNYSGLNTVIADSARQNGVQWWGAMPLATEYLVFAVLFCLIVLLPFGAKGLKIFSVPLLFLVVVGALYTIDNVYPYGKFTPLQFLVPATTTLAATVLNLLGCKTILTTQTDPSRGSLSLLTATDPHNPIRTARFEIAWPCAGIESLLIFTVVILLFLKRMPISWKAKAGYFAIGAAVTYFINILRIVTIFTIGMNGGDVDSFHYYYGPLYSVAWIVLYPLIILGSQSLWHEITNRKNRVPQSYGENLHQPESVAFRLGNFNHLSQALLNQDLGVFNRQGCNVLNHKWPVGLHICADYRWNILNEPQGNPFVNFLCVNF